MEELEDKIKQFDLLKTVNKIKKEYKPIIDKIIGRYFYYPAHESSKYPEWNIKVYYANNSGHLGPEKTDKKWDVLWEKYIKKHDNFFWDCCESGLDFVGDKKTRQYDWNAGIPEIEDSDYELWQAGRSGGHLYLKSFEGRKTDYNTFKEFSAYLNETIGIETDYYYVDSWISDINNYLPDIDWLKRLIIFCESLDKFNANEEWNYQCNYRRSEKEHEWESGDFGDFDEYELEEILNYEYPDIPDNARDKTIIKTIDEYFDLIIIQDKIRQYLENTKKEETHAQLVRK